MRSSASARHHHIHMPPTIPRTARTANAAAFPRRVHCVAKVPRHCETRQLKMPQSRKLPETLGSRLMGHVLVLTSDFSIGNELGRRAPLPPDGYTVRGMRARCQGKRIDNARNSLTLGGRRDCRRGPQNSPTSLDRPNDRGMPIIRPSSSSPPSRPRPPGRRRRRCQASPGPLSAWR